ncbi:MAG: hypothetical protein KTR31_31615 [Myxococcales bacterium]|nr:hypothetical protein [Myxococcales bacterium]
MRSRPFPLVLALLLPMACSGPRDSETTGDDPTNTLTTPQPTTTTPTTAPGTDDLGCLPEPHEVTDEGSYQSLVDARVSAEIVRVELRAADRPRLAAAAALLVAYATENPLASSAQLTTFASELDAALSTWASGDPELTQPHHLVPALRHAAATLSHPALAGTRTDVGERATEWLGMNIRQRPSDDRAVAFDRAHLVAFDRHQPFAHLVTQAMLDRSPDACVRPGLAAALQSWATTQQLELRPADLQASYPGVAAAKAALPQSVQAFFAQRDTGFVDLRAAVRQSYDDTAKRIAALGDEIADALEDEPDVVETGPLTKEELADLIAQRAAEAQARTESRATVSLVASLMEQSEVEADVGYAAQAEEVADAQGTTEDVLAYVRDGIKVAGGVGAFVAGVKLAKPGVAIAGLVSVADGAYGLFGPDEGPPPEKEILEQILQLRQQVEDLRVQMHDRFDRIDSRLNEMFDALSAGLEALDASTRTIDGNVRELSRELYATRSSVLEGQLGLHEALQAGFVESLIDDIEFGLAFHERTGKPLDYAGSGSNSFFALQSRFYTAAAIDAKNTLHAGSDVLDLDEATVTLTSDLALQVNALAQFPAALGEAPLSSTRLANPRMWSVGADAFAQMARENPWYFARVHDSDPGRLTELIETGEAVESALQLAADPVWIERLVDELQLEVLDLEVEVGLLEFLRDGDYSEEFDPYLGVNQVPNRLGLPVRIVTKSSFPAGFDHSALWGLHDPLFAAAAVTRFPGWGLTRWDTVMWHQSSFWHFDHVSPPYTRVSTPLRDMTYTPNLLATWGEWGAMELHYDPAPPKDVSQWFTDHPGLLETLCGAQVGDEVDVDGIIVSVATRTITPFKNDELDPSPPLPRPDVGDLTDHIQQIQEAYEQRLDERLLAAAPRFRTIDNLATVLDAYLSLGAPQSLLDDEILRARLRGDAEVRLGHLEATGGLGRYETYDVARQSGVRPPDLEPTLLPASEQLLERLLPVLEEGVPQKHAYLEWSLQGLRALERSVFALSADDAYATTAGTTLQVGATLGVLSNDAEQPGAASITAAVTVEPSNGTLTLGSDGSLTYVPDAGFVGEDSFAYEATAMLTSDTPEIQVTAEPAMVVIRVE